MIVFRYMKLDLGALGLNESLVYGEVTRSPTGEHVSVRLDRVTVTIVTGHATPTFEVTKALDAATQATMCEELEKEFLRLEAICEQE